MLSRRYRPSAEVPEVKTGSQDRKPRPEVENGSHGRGRAATSGIRTQTPVPVVEPRVERSEGAYRLARAGRTDESSVMSRHAAEVASILTDRPHPHP